MARKVNLVGISLKKILIGTAISRHWPVREKFNLVGISGSLLLGRDQEGNDGVEGLRLNQGFEVTAFAFHGCGEDVQFLRR